MQELKKDPIWLQAADDAVSEFSYGDIIPHAWIARHLGIEYPDEPITIEEHRARDFDMLSKVEALKDELLTSHKRYLLNVRGVGYKIVKPKNQTSAAMLKLNRELRKSLCQAMSALVHVNETALSLEDCRENAEAKAKVAAINAMNTKRLA